MNNEKVLIHIGIHKTGTSSIQSFLSKNSARILEEDEVLYVETGRDVEAEEMHAGHHHLAWKTVERYAERKGVELDRTLWGDVVEEINQKRPDLSILSSEFFWPATEREIKYIADALHDFDTRILVYVRNQKSLAKSIYRQIVKGEKYVGGIKEVVKNRTWIFDYQKIVSKWESVFGESSVEMKIFEKQDDGVVRGFADRAGITWQEGAEMKQNVSPPDQIIHLVRGLNAVENVCPSALKPFVHRARRNILGGREPGNTVYGLVAPFLSSTIMSPSCETWFRRKTKNMRERFIKEYVSRSDRKIFKV